MSEEIIIGDIEKSAPPEVLRVRVVTLGGRRLVDVRTFYSDEDPTGEEPQLKPTKRGLCLTPRVWVQLLGDIERAIERAVSEDERPAA